MDNMDGDDLYAIKLTPPRARFPETITPAEAEVIGRHFEYLKALHAQGRVKLVGRTEGGSFGLAIVRAPSLAAAQALLAGDPAIKERVFTGEVDLFRLVFEG